MKLLFLVTVLIGSAFSHAYYNIDKIQKGTIMVVYQNDFEIPANTSFVKISDTFDRRRYRLPNGDLKYFNIPISYDMKVRKSSDANILYKGDEIYLVRAEVKKGKCSPGSAKTYYEVKIYADHPQIEYFRFRSGLYIPEANGCGYDEGPIYDVHLDTENAFAIPQVPVLKK